MNNNRTLRTSQNRRRGDRSIAEKQLSTETKSLVLLTEIRDLNVTQARGDVPTVPDVPYPTLRRDRVYTFERTFQPTTIVIQGTVPGDLTGAISVALNQFPDFVEFTSLFDEYRIEFLEFLLVPVTGTNQGSPIYTVLDYDDSTPLTGVAQTLEYQTLMITQPGQFHKRSLIPRVDVAIYNGIASTGYGTRAHQWIDAGSPAIPHYGLKYAAPFVSGANYQITVLCRAILQFRNPR